jgi:hypothetical protein
VAYLKDILGFIKEVEMAVGSKWTKYNSKALIFFVWFLPQHIKCTNEAVGKARLTCTTASKQVQ